MEVLLRASMCLALLILLSLASASPTMWSMARGLVEDPAKDAFYQPPAGFEFEAPGTVLRNRSITASFFGLIPDPVEAHQLLYRTTATNGSAIATVTTVFKPSNPMKDRFLAYLTAYDSSTVQCNPSYQYQLGTPQTDLFTSIEMLIIEAYLLMGHVVASPDYEGPDAAYSSGRLEGMAVLDGMRAVGNYHDTLGLSSATPKIVSTGYSGGALAAGWAASLQSSYAPELDIKGYVAGGTPANLTASLAYIDSTTSSGLIPAALAGLSKPSAYGAQLTPIFNEIFTPLGRDKLTTAENQCAVADILSFFDKSIFSTDIQKLGDGLLFEPTIADILAENTMGLKPHETPIAPIFFYHAREDMTIPYANVSILVDDWCANGASVKFTTLENGGHITSAILALPEVVDFVKAAFGDNTETKCTRSSILKSKLNPLALGGSLEPTVGKLVQVLNDAGKEDENILEHVKVLEKKILA